MAAALRPLRLPGFPNLSARLSGQRARQLARRDRARDPRLRPDRQPDGDRGAVLRHALRPGASRARRWSRGVEASRCRSACRCSTRPRRSPSGSCALLVDNFALVFVLILATFDGSIASAARALTRAAAAAVLAPAGQLREGNALLNVAFTVGSAGGPALAGLVVAGAGHPGRADRRRRLVPRRRRRARRCAPLRAPGARRAAACRGPSACGAGSPTCAAVRALRRLLAAQALAFIFFALVIPIEVVFAKRDARRGRRRIRRPARQLGRRDAGRQLPLRRPAPGSRCALLLVCLDARDRRRLSRHLGRPHARRRLRRLGRRRARQRRPVDRAGDRGPGADPRRLPGAGAVAARGARERDAGRRLPARRRDRRALQPRASATRSPAPACSSCSRSPPAPCGGIDWAPELEQGADPSTGAGAATASDASSVAEAGASRTVLTGS